ncbi:GreA/GreB family elongation factor [Sphingobium nicotianae]|uniref:GreA/GreB family elongation factor n=1 Tax=Sphingobium nicotianae TaxID=2782607 RepID=A0A9X1DC14_9SPHN|nr:GreA/GreB family elongation factor [Sphingobium nicotianae]MBT2187174.1 GreA/GreB family elongation factor [Sphingobium nicotianae]
MEDTSGALVSAPPSPDVLTMHANVDFIDETNGPQSEIQLVYPREEDIAAGHFSTLMPVGAGLIGRREG